MYNRPDFSVLTGFVAQSVLLLGCLQACGNKVETGRNEDPSEWPKSTELSGDGGQEPPKNPQDNVANNGSKAKCFTTESETLPSKLKDICATVVSTNPRLEKINQYLCTKKLFVGNLKQPTCGWNGDANLVSKYYHRYELEPDNSGNDYEDVHATIVHASVSAKQFVDIVRLAFQDFQAFNSKGLKWVRGTKSNSNLNNGTFESGIDYAFRAETEAYPFGYNGRIQLFEIDNSTWLHLNYSTTDHQRISHFSQATIYSKISETNALVFKLEHKKIESTGLYTRVKKTAYDAAIDFMTDMHSNTKVISGGAL
ncbi:MAG: hypothetical protein NT027_03180 [Proteobacteria bacterium]|nr:hypothetical protein [Pseudomonadota bacterium]